MNRKFNFSVGEFYHVYNRGTDKRIIFLDSYDYYRFIILLYLCNSSNPIDIQKLTREGYTFTDFLKIDIGEKIVHIGAYCLMPNHFHLLIKEKQEGGVSLFMKKLMTAYSMYFNKKYERKGRLFEGTFKAQHANVDEYLKYLFSYIHLNPVKLIDSTWREDGIKDKIATQKYLQNYQYSSYLDFVGEDRINKKILTIDAFPEYFSGVKSFNDFINEWLMFSTLVKV